MGKSVKQLIFIMAPVQNKNPLNIIRRVLLNLYIILNITYLLVILYIEINRLHRIDLYVLDRNTVIKFFNEKIGVAIAWVISSHHYSLLNVLLLNLILGYQRESFLILKTLFEDICVAHDYYLNFSLGKKYRSNLKNARKIFDEEFKPFLEYEYESMLNLYGHFNELSHFNHEFLKDFNYNVVNNQPKLFKQSLKGRYLLALDVYMHLYQFYFPVRNIYIPNKFKDEDFFVKENEKIVGIKIPTKVVLRIDFLTKLVTNYF